MNLIFRDLCNTKLLEKCVHGRTQNSNESLVSVIWTRLPKTVFIGRGMLHIDVTDVVAFNTGNLAKVKILRKLCGLAGGNCVIGLKCLDELRQRNPILADIALAKTARQKNTNIMRKREDEDNDEGTYALEWKNNIVTTVSLLSLIHI